MSGKEVFIVGPGFIGWNVLDLLISENYTVTALVRRDTHASQIASSGATPLISDLNDSTTITNQTTKSDIILHTATADHLPSVLAILAGIKQRAAAGKPTIFIHTSGTSVLDDGINGHSKSDKIYHDDTTNPSDIDTVPDSAPHREIDLAIVKAAGELEEGGKAKMAIMIPPLIYGFNPAHKRLTIQIPTLTRFALKHGYVPHVGTGEPVESNIHVLDLARAYVVLLHLLEGCEVGDGRLGNLYWFCEATGDREPSWKEVAEVIQGGLREVGRRVEVRTLEEEHYGDLFGDFTGAVVGLNSRSRANRLRELGWEAREKGWKESYLEDELPEILKEENWEGFQGYFGTVAS